MIFTFGNRGVEVKIIATGIEYGQEIAPAPSGLPSNFDSSLNETPSNFASLALGNSLGHSPSHARSPFLLPSAEERSLYLPYGAYTDTGPPFGALQSNRLAGVSLRSFHAAPSSVTTTSGSTNIGNAISRR